MVAVNTLDGIKYGFRLLGYLMAVVVAGGILVVIGTQLAPGPFDRGSPILALIFLLAGLAVMYAGGLGLLYKVIADGVETGNLAATRRGYPEGGGRSPRDDRPPQDPRTQEGRPRERRGSRGGQGQ